jgi:hypothetical protein
MWYAVNTLYRSEHTPTETQPTLWEESIFLIEAGSEEDARSEAERIGRSRTHSYEVESGLVIWSFQQIERVYAIDREDLRSGTEVFCRFLRDSEVKSLLTRFDDEM